MGKKLQRFFVSALAFTVATFIFFALLEGIASTGITAVKLFGRISREQVHSQYDPEVGWVSKPRLFIQNMYGNGVFLKTNDQSLREAEHVQRSIPSGKIRVVCSGDSFTFGHGVDNDHAWCTLLETKNERIDAINAGQVGYGIGQSFLLYERVAEQIDHQIQIFAFITDDFRRAALSRFLGYPKPRLALKNDELVVENSPVPRRMFNNPYLIITAETLNELALMRSIRRLSTLAGDSSSSAESKEIDHDEIRRLVSTTFRELVENNLREGRITALVYLPSGIWDYHFQNPDTESWRSYLVSEAEKNGWFFIDLIEDFNQLEKAFIAGLFDGHYSVEGNRYVAERIYQHLMDAPDVKSLLDN